MRKIIAATFISIDGVMQAPGGPEEDPTGGFKFGGWQAPHFDEKLGNVIDRLFKQPFNLLLGRKTTISSPPIGRTRPRATPSANCSTGSRNLSRPAILTSGSIGKRASRSDPASLRL